MHRRVSLKMIDLNSHLRCYLCKGYFIDAATITECLHSFCKSCIVRYIRKKEACPICKLEIIREKISTFLKKDSNLQCIVYKLVPNLFKNEMERRRNFYSTHPRAIKHKKRIELADKEAVGEIDEKVLFAKKRSYDNMSISIEYSETGLAEICESQRINFNSSNKKRYLECPPAFPVRLLKKFIAMRLNLIEFENYIEVMYDDKPLKDELTLIDIAYIYAWRPRIAPMRLFYRFSCSQIKEEAMSQIAEPSDTKTKSLNLTTPKKAIKLEPC